MRVCMSVRSRGITDLLRVKIGLHVSYTTYRNRSQDEGSNTHREELWADHWSEDLTTRWAPGTPEGFDLRSKLSDILRHRNEVTSFSRRHSMARGARMYVCKILEESPVRWAGPNAPITTHKESHGGGSNRVSYTPVTG